MPSLRTSLLAMASRIPTTPNPNDAGAPHTSQVVISARCLLPSMGSVLTGKERSGSLV